MTRRDPATDPTARDRATGHTARDAPDGTRSGDGSSRTRRPFATPCPATGHSRRDGPNGMRSGDGRYRTRHALSHAIRRRTIRYAMIISYPNMPGNARKCPDDVRTMPDDVSLPGLSGTCLWVASGPTLGLNCAAGRRVDRHNYKHETSIIKRTRLRAAPAASIAGHVGPLVDNDERVSM